MLANQEEDFCLWPLGLLLIALNSIQFCYRSTAHWDNLKPSTVCTPRSAEVQGETDHLNRAIPMKEIKPIINSLPKQKHQGQMGSLMYCTKHLRRILYQFSTIFQKTEAERILPDLLCGLALP